MKGYICKIFPILKRLLERPGSVKVRIIMLTFFQGCKRLWRLLKTKMKNYKQEKMYLFSHELV